MKQISSSVFYRCSIFLSHASVALLLSWLVPVATAADNAHPKAASSDLDWTGLSSQLSTNASATTPTPTEWKEQCWDVFENVHDSNKFRVNSYDLVAQPSGVCMVYPVCSFWNCFLPPTFLGTVEKEADGEYPNPYYLSESQLNLDEETLVSSLQLPAQVVYPTYVGDIVTAVQFAKTNQVGITIKTSGHSFVGASTANQTLLIQMNAKYPIYSQHVEDNLRECSMEQQQPDMPVVANGANATMEPSPRQASTTTSTTTSAMDIACAMAKSRGKHAVLRVGGGEVWDHAYRAIRQYNADKAESAAEEAPIRYHLVGGGAGSVSAAGGWLQSGGLSGTNGMRQFGFGCDQVLHIEMVLPSGTHVRFGPSEWGIAADTEEEMLYPATTTVAGFCNAKPMEEDEADWEWGPCEEDIDFEGLWFAVRGGGGGTFGIVTSLYYQLHEQPGDFDLLYSGGGGDWEETWNQEQIGYYFRIYIEFILKFFFNPSALNVMAEHSNACQSPFLLALNAFHFGSIICYGEGTKALVGAWGVFLAEHTDRLLELGLDQATIDDAKEIFGSVPYFGNLEDYGDLAIGFPGPKERYTIYTEASVIMDQPAYPRYDDTMNVYFPLANLTSGGGAFDDTLDLLTEYVLSVIDNPEATLIYTTGGVVPIASDRLDSVNPTRRNSAFMMAVLDDEYKSRFYDIFWDAQDGRAVTGDDFPGTTCHNHAFIYEMGPMKSDWTKACPSDWTQEKRQQECVSQEEANWGTSNLARLESVKKAVDPNRLFICAGGVGYAVDTTSPVAADDEPTSTDTSASRPTDFMSSRILYFAAGLACLVFETPFT